MCFCCCLDDAVQETEVIELTNCERICGPKLETVLAREVNLLYKKAIEEKWTAQKFMNERERILNYYGKKGLY